MCPKTGLCVWHKARPSGSVFCLFLGTGSHGDLKCHSGTKYGQYVKATEPKGSWLRKLGGEWKREPQHRGRVEEEKQGWKARDSKSATKTGSGRDGDEMARQMGREKMERQTPEPR